MPDFPIMEDTVASFVLTRPINTGPSLSTHPNFSLSKLNFLESSDRVKKKLWWEKKCLQSLTSY